MPDDTTQTGLLDPALQSQLNQIAQAALGAQQPVHVDTTPVQQDFLSKVGEWMGGGADVGALSPAQRQAAGLKALGDFGTSLMAASRYQPGQTIFSNLAQGFQGAERGYVGSEARAAQMLGAQQDYQTKQQEMRLSALKEAIPLLQMSQQQRSLDAARKLATGPSTPSIAAAGAGAGGIEPSQMVGSIASALGIPVADAAAIASNLHAESGLNPGINEIAPKEGRGGYGLAQWTGPRRDALEAYAKTNGLDVSSPSTQLAFMKQEITQDHPDLLKQMQAAKTPEEKAAIFYQQYERGPANQMAAHTARAGAFATLPAPGSAPGGGGTATAAMPPPATPAPPATTAAVPGGGFGASAFAAPTRTVMPTPETTANAPNVATALPAVPTPAMTAAQAIAAKTGKPAPIAGGQGLVANPDGTVGTPGAGGVGKRADLEAILRGVQTAQTTMPPSAVAAAGPAAGGGGAVVAPAEAPASAFGGGAFAGPPARVVGQPTPQPASQQPTTTPPPAITTTPVQPTAPARVPDTFVAPRVDIPPDIQRRIDHPQISPDFDRQIAIAAGGMDAGKIQEAVKAKAAAEDAARAPALKEAQDYRDRIAASQQEVWKTLRAEQQANDKAAADRQHAIALKNIEAEQQRQTNVESAIVGVSTDRLKDLQARAGIAQRIVRDSSALEALAPQLGDPNALLANNPKLRDALVTMNLPWLAGANLNELKAQQAWDKIVTGLFQDTHVPGSGSQSNIEGEWMMRQFGGPEQTPEDRMTQLAIVRKLAENRIADHRDAQDMFMAQNGKLNGLDKKIAERGQLFDRPPEWNVRDPQANKGAQNRYLLSHPRGEPYAAWSTPDGGVTRGDMRYFRNELVNGRLQPVPLFGGSLVARP